jgi:hypothetical protein
MLHPEVLGLCLYSINFSIEEIIHAKVVTGRSPGTTFAPLIKMEGGEKVNIVSDHIPIHKKPVSDDEFGSYLAGLIEGDGYINKKVISITIVFHQLDAPLAYFIKKRIGYGVVDKIKNKNALLYRANLEGSIVIAKLINGKLRTAKIDNFYCLLELINKRISTPIILKEKDTSDLTKSY